MKIGTPDAAEKLEGQIAVLNTVCIINLSCTFSDGSQRFQKYGEWPAVQFLKLEIIRREREPNSDEFFQGNVIPLYWKGIC